MIEFEIKSSLKETKAILDFLQTLKYLGEKNVVDEYYDTTNALFFQAGVFIRIRNRKHFDIKYNDDFIDTSHISCHEYSFDFPTTRQG